jgi:D-lyxose ketol-isomerase
MKRSEINFLIEAATSCFQSHGWTLPPRPQWDVTDFGLGDWQRFGLVLINLAEEPEYCEKLMYARREMTTPSHTHRLKKEDIVVRWGSLNVQLWNGRPGETSDRLTINVNGNPVWVASGGFIELRAGERITLIPGVYHEFSPATDECIIGEVSSENDDLNDNFFADPKVGRFSEIEEDEPAISPLVSDEPN